MFEFIKKLNMATHALTDTLRDELGFSERKKRSAIDALFEAYSLAHYLPDETYDPEADIYPYVHASHMMFECSTLIGASEETVNLLSSILTDILPPESIVQALFWASPKIGPLIDEMEHQRSQGSKMLNALAQKRAAFYRQGVYQSLTQESHLYSYTKEGRYGHYFEAPCLLNFNKNLVILELGGLDGNKELQRIVLKILMYQIINVMYYKPLHIPKTCLIDEAYDLLSDDGKGGNANFANEGYRRAPKYGGNFITITHGLDDYEKNPTAKMCYDNAYYKIFLGASKNTIDTLKRSNQLDAYGERLLRSLKITKEYSEFLLMCEEQFTVHRLIVDPFSRLLNTTRGTEVEAIKRLQVQGYSLVDAITEVAKEVYGDVA